MKKFLGAAALSAVLVAAWIAWSGVMVVDVHEADGGRVVVPVPLAFARPALAFAPDDAKRIEVREVEPYLPYARRIVDGLRDAPDGLLVEIVDGDEHVRVWKEGRTLRVRVVQGDETDVAATIPLESAEKALRAYDAGGRYFRTAGLLSALSAAPRGELVNVTDGGDRIRIRRVF